MVTRVTVLDSRNPGHVVSDFRHWHVVLEGDDVSSLGADGVFIDVDIVDVDSVDIVDGKSSDAWQSRHQQECEMLEQDHVCCCLKEYVMQM